MSIYKVANYFIHWKFPTSAERLAAVVTPGDIGKVAQDLDTNGLFLRLAGSWMPLVAPASGSIARYSEIFTAASTWTVNHNLNREPFVQVLTTGGIEMLADVLVVSLNQVVVTFSQPQAGRVQVF